MPGTPRPPSDLHSPAQGHPIRRRALLGGAVTLGAAALGTAFGASPSQASSPGVVPGSVVTEPFTLGVASGDPDDTSVLLWTRLAPEPLAENGLGGMPDSTVEVEWQIAHDERFSDVVASGTVETGPERAHSVHVEAEGLRPRADYFYRFRVGNEISPVGRTRTTPAPGSPLDRFAFAFASCQSYSHGHYTAQAHLAEEDLDLVAFLGDYIYETPDQGEIGRGHFPETEVRSLTEYRLRHAQYKTDTDLQAAHAAFPWAVVFDDHELENNWAGENSYEEDVPPEQFLERREQALRAYYEHMPLRPSQRPAGPDLHLYRTLSYGGLVDIHLLDTRQYRDPQVEDAGREDPDRTLLGADQRRWLSSALSSSGATWNVLAQQVFFSQRDFADGPPHQFSDDAWDNYKVERDSVRDELAGVANPVVITGDVHANYVVDVKADFDDPDSETVATELVGTSFTSGRDGVEQGPDDETQLRGNPHIKFVNRHRGYVRNTLTPEQWTADYRVVDYVSEPGSPIRDRAGFVIGAGEPGARPLG